jgi:hypothetical protein
MSEWLLITLHSEVEIASQRRTTTGVSFVVELPTGYAEVLHRAAMMPAAGA